MSKSQEDQKEVSAGEKLNAFLKEHGIAFSVGPLEIVQDTKGGIHISPPKNIVARYIKKSK